ncbi:hypothetical protein BB560_004923, partial [Smittium megazygosporum]
MSNNQKFGEESITVWNPMLSNDIVYLFKVDIDDIPTFTSVSENCVLGWQNGVSDLNSQDILWNNSKGVPGDKPK